MTDAARLMSVLQHADSFFPSGAVSFSWGLEGLHRDAELGSVEAVSRFVTAQLRFRWATFDRPVLLAAHQRAHNPKRLGALDEATEALSLGREFREASRRLGAALLSVHARLATPGAEAYREMVTRGAAFGHLSVVQGLVWRGVGMAEDAAAATSAHSLCVTLLGAAVRLSLIGHIEAQRALAAQREVVASILGEPPPSQEDIGTFTPHTDVASMRHEAHGVRLFAN